MCAVNRRRAGLPGLRGRRVPVELDAGSAGAHAVESLRRARKIVARWIISKALSTPRSATGDRR